MTDETTDSPAPAVETAAPEAALAASPNSLSGKGKAFWVGVGIGSAALVAALMYARRPKKRK